MPLVINIAIQARNKMSAALWASLICLLLIALASISTDKYQGRVS